MSKYDYLCKYVSNRTWSPSTSPGTIQRAQTAINAIQNNHDVSASMLESVISLTYHPILLAEILGDPGLIQDCILYLCRREKEGVQVFDDEQGYLCFRILVLAINVSIISKYDNPKFWQLLASTQGNQDANEALSNAVEVILVRQIANPIPDQITDWDSQLPQNMITSKRNILFLLALLSEDRKGFLRAWSETKSPTLSGLLFILRRCVYVHRTPLCLVHFLDVARRNYLATSVKGTATTEQFEDDFAEYHHVWRSSNPRLPLAADLEDARTQLALLTKKIHFEPAGPSFTKPFADFATCLLACTLPEEGFILGVEDLFVPLLEEAFGSTWRYLGVHSTSVAPVPLDTLVDYFGALVMMGTHMIRHLINYPTANVSPRELLQVMVDEGIIEILARSILLIDGYYRTEIAGKMYDVADNLRAFKLFVDECHHILGLQGLDTMFDHTFTDWFKTLNYKNMQDAIYGTHTRHEEWFEEVTNFWRRLGDLLGHTFREIQYAIIAPECSYARCHDPLATESFALLCICDQSVYCGVRCQQMDWVTHAAAFH